MKLHYYGYTDEQIETLREARQLSVPSTGKPWPYTFGKVPEQMLDEMDARDIDKAKKLFANSAKLMLDIVSVPHGGNLPTVALYALAANIPFYEWDLGTEGDQVINYLIPGKIQNKDEMRSESSKGNVYTSKFTAKYDPEYKEIKKKNWPKSVDAFIAGAAVVDNAGKLNEVNKTRDGYVHPAEVARLRDNGFETVYIDTPYEEYKKESWKWGWSQSNWQKAIDDKNMDQYQLARWNEVKTDLTAIIGGKPVSKHIIEYGSPYDMLKQCYLIDVKRGLIR